jgi:hypothetical protein
MFQAERTPSALLKKGNVILLRRVGKRRVQFDGHDKLFFNNQRPHQGIQHQIPRPDESGRTHGAVRKSAVLGGLHHHYYGQTA